MNSIYEWHPRIKCPKCGWHTYAPFGNIFHVHFTCCPTCGTHKPSRIYSKIKIDGKDEYWEIVTMRKKILRFVPYKLWNPFTWFNYYTEWERLP